MLRAERLFAGRQGALVERPCPRQVALGLEKAGEVAEDRGRVEMLRAAHLLVNRQRALEQRPRPRKVALGLEHEGEVVEARIRMLGAERLFSYCQYIAEELLCSENRPLGRGNSCPRNSRGRTSLQTRKRHRDAPREVPAGADVSSAHIGHDSGSRYPSSG